MKIVMLAIVIAALSSCATYDGWGWQDATYSYDPHAN